MKKRIGKKIRKKVMEDMLKLRYRALLHFLDPNKPIGGSKDLRIG